MASAQSQRSESKIFITQLQREHPREFPENVSSHATPIPESTHEQITIEVSTDKLLSKISKTLQHWCIKLSDETSPNMFYSDFLKLLQQQRPLDIYSRSTQKRIEKGLKRYGFTVKYHQIKGLGLKE